MARRVGGEAAIQARIAAAPGLSAADSHRLAGLLEAECHLAVGPNNTDGWRCSCGIALRDDDRETLEYFKERLGIGNLKQIPARNGSRPQVVWDVQSKAECRRLVSLLDAHPMRGRKLGQYELWREAVSEWAACRYGVTPASMLRLAEIAAALAKARAYQPPADGTAPPRMYDAASVSYFAGFFSGEGCFQLQPRDARFVIKVRRDDRPLLEAFQKRFGIGHVRDVPSPPRWAPAVRWTAVSASDVLTGVALFDAAGLLGRKQRQFVAWKPGALAVASAKITRGPLDPAVVDASRRALAQATAYTPPARPLRRDRGFGDARTAYISILRRWGETVDGKLSSTSYEAVRALNPHWPKRDTIAFAFGSWYEALRCAGLEDRAARRPSAV
jgi:hypothetical protein